MTPPPLRYEAWAPTPPSGTIELDELIAGEGPLELDIGFGRGRSLFERAEVSPTSRVIGLEVKAKLVVAAELRRVSLGLTSLRVFRADALDVMRRARPSCRVSRVSVHFPDPWWKKRHAKRRVVNARFLEEAARLLEPGGHLFIQTDVEDRAFEYGRLVSGDPSFERLGASGFFPENPLGARSDREVRALADGLPVYRILARRD